MLGLLVPISDCFCIEKYTSAIDQNRKLTPLTNDIKHTMHQFYGARITMKQFPEFIGEKSGQYGAGCPDVARLLGTWLAEDKDFWRVIA